MESKGPGQTTDTSLATVEALIGEAVDHAAAGSIEKARASLREAERLAASMTPPSRDWWAGFAASSGYVLHQSGEYEAAVSRWPSALDIYPAHPSNRSYTSVLVWMAESLRWFGAIGAARQRYEVLLAWSPRVPKRERITVERVLAMCEGAIGDTDAAIRRLERLADTDDSIPVAARAGICFSLGRLQAISENHELAARCYRRAIAMAGYDDKTQQARGWLGLVSCLHAAGRHDEAARALREARRAVESVDAPTFRLQLDLEEAEHLRRRLPDGGTCAGAGSPGSNRWSGCGRLAATARSRSCTARANSSVPGRHSAAIGHLEAADEIEENLAAFPARRTRILSALADAYEHVGREEDAERARATADRWPGAIRERSDRLSAAMSPEKLRPPKTRLHRHVDVVVVAGIVGAVVAGAAVALHW